MLIDNFSDDQKIWDSKAFPQQSNPNEDIVLLVREDKIILIFTAIGYSLLLLILVIIKSVSSSLFTQIPGINSIVDFFVAIGVIGLVIGFVRFIHNFFLSIQIVTTDRIIDIDQTGIFKREVNELALQNIQDVTYKQVGILQSMLGYGEVIIKTSSVEVGATEGSSMNGFVFNNCPNPSKVSGIINDLYHKNKKEDIKMQAVASAEELKKAFGGNVIEDDIFNQLPM